MFEAKPHACVQAILLRGQIRVHHDALQGSVSKGSGLSCTGAMPEPARFKRKGKGGGFSAPQRVHYAVENDLKPEARAGGREPAFGHPPSGVCARIHSVAAHTRRAGVAHTWAVTKWQED